MSLGKTKESNRSKIKCLPKIGNLGVLLENQINIIKQHMNICDVSSVATG